MVNGPESVRADIETYIAVREAWIQDAVEVITGDRNTDPAVALQERTMDTEGAVRDDTVGLNFTDDQEQALREIAGRFGLGGHVDVLSHAEHQVQEGGKPWKIEAQLAISKGLGTRSIIMCGWPGRNLGADEQDYLQQKYGIAPTNEYEMARALAERQEGFVADETTEVLPFGYDIHDENRFLQEKTGQLVKIGSIDGIPVLLVRIDNDWLEVKDPATDQVVQRKPINRPDSAAIMLFISDFLWAHGDTTGSIGFNTSSTYASRAIDTVRASLDADRRFSVGMYGRETLRSTGAPNIPAESPINQLPSELRIIYFDKLQRLKAELQP